jgi:diketogulonate reductase-like aldo/keto reductase
VIGIALTAYSPLGSAKAVEGVVPLLKNETVAAIAAELGRSPAQVAIRWGIQKHVIVRPSPLSRACVCVRSVLMYTIVVVVVIIR